MADNESIINCPACGKRMHKIFMPVQNVNLDVCLDGCGGIYFDNREFKMFEKPYDDMTPILEAYKGKTFQKTYDGDLRICPNCGMKMVKNYHRSTRDFKIDECYGCGARFLDYSELENIRNAATAGRYSKRPVKMSGDFYKDLEQISADSETFAEINIPELNTPEYNTTEYDTPQESPLNEYYGCEPAQDYSHLYIVDGSAIKKEMTLKGFVWGIGIGFFISIIFIEKYTEMLPLIYELHPEADDLTLEAIYFLSCIGLCSIIGIIISKYLYSKIYNRF